MWSPARDQRSLQTYAQRSHLDNIGLTLLVLGHPSHHIIVLRFKSSNSGLVHWWKYALFVPFRPADVASMTTSHQFFTKFQSLLSFILLEKLQACHISKFASFFVHAAAFLIIFCSLLVCWTVLSFSHQNFLLFCK